MTVTMMTVRALNEDYDDDDDAVHNLPIRAMSTNTMYDDSDDDGDGDEYDQLGDHDDNDHHHGDDSVLPLHLYLSIVQFQRPVRHDLPHTQTPDSCFDFDL